MSVAAEAAGETAPRQGGPFSRQAVIVMVLVGVVSFSAYFVLSAYAPDLREPTDGGAHALSKSAVGFAGAVELLRERGAPVVISRGRSGGGLGEGLLVVTPDAYSTAALDDLLSPTAQTLVVLPKWRTRPDLRVPGWVIENGQLPVGEVAAVLPKRFGRIEVARDAREARHAIGPVASELRFGAAETSGPINGFQTISGDRLVPLLAEKGGDAVLARIENTSIYVLAEPDLLNTQGLADLDSAWLGAHVVETLAGPKNPVHFDVTLHGFERTRNLLKLAFEPPFLSATLCAVAAAILMGLNAAARFGPARRGRRAFALGKKALVDNSAALVRMTRREVRMAHGYAALTLASAAQAVGARRGADEAGQRAILDRLSGVAGLPRSYSELAQAADAAEDPASLLDAARALHAWRMEMTRERR